MNVTPEERDEKRRAYQRAYQAEYRQKHLEEHRRRDRERDKSPERREAKRLKAERYRQEHPEKVRATSQTQNAKIKASRTEIVQTTLATQGGVCAVCRTVTEPTKGWHQDHDHSCCLQRLAHRRCGNCERGVLCASCNMGIGMFRDDPDLLSAAIEYLAKWPRRIRDKETLT